MPFIPDLEAFKKSIAALPVIAFDPGETILYAGSTTGQLFILRHGEVEVLRDGQQIATVSQPGAIFGELALILDKPHTADVRAVERAEFHFAEASTLLKENVAALLYVTATLAHRLDAANDIIVDIKRDLDSGKSPSMMQKALKKLEELLVPTGPIPEYYYYPY